MKTRIAVSLGLPDTRSCLAALRELGDRIGLAEVRLDLMGSFDLPRLFAEAPCPLIVTCRPRREGGRFAGSEAERLALLRTAAGSGAAFVDVEWDALDGFGRPEGAGLIASRHWPDGMPDDLEREYRALAGRADVVKLVGTAKRAADVVPVLRLLARAETPVVAVAMGEAGAATRLLAPCFASCFLTYGAAGPGAATAPGQLTVAEMVDGFGLDRAGVHTRGHLHLCASAGAAAAVRRRQLAARPGEELHVPLLAVPDELAAVAAVRLPGITVVEEAAMSAPDESASDEKSQTQGRRASEAVGAGPRACPRGVSTPRLSRADEEGTLSRPGQARGPAPTPDREPARRAVSEIRLWHPWTVEAATEIVLGRGVLDDLPGLLEPHRGARLVLVSDSNVAPLHAEPLRRDLTAAGWTTHLLALPAGEQAKTFETLTRLYGECRALEIERDDVVVAVGGGMVGDVAGMLAATYLRGLPLVQVPTSLVAMVTAAVGGKVGVNFGGAKNLIGAFKHPRLVIADLAALDTLPRRELLSGLGELVTVGVLGAPEIFEAMEEGRASDLAPWIAAALACKSRIVEADPEDRLGIRARLNLGHTFGHALEALSGFELAHGLAVAAGLHTASRLAAALGICEPSLPERVRATLQRTELPTAVAGFRAEQVVEAMRSDKKRRGGRLRWVLPEAVGRVTLVGEERVPAALLHDVLRQTVEAQP